jgi:hypothetical protein
MQTAPDSREIKGKAIAENGNVKKVSDQSFRAKSQTVESRNYFAYHLSLDA